MIKRVAVRIALVMVLLVVLAAALPLAASADVYIHGHVWDISSLPDWWGNDPWGLGIPGAEVVLEKDGRPIRPVSITNQDGSWGFGISGVPGTYTVRVTTASLAALQLMSLADGRSGFLLSAGAAVRLGTADPVAGMTWQTLPYSEAAYTFVLFQGQQPPIARLRMLGPIDFLFTCSTPMMNEDPRRPDQLPCYLPQWNQIYVHGVVKQVGTMAFVGGVGLQLLQEVLAQDGSRTGVFLPAMRLVAGEIPTPVTCVSQVNANTNGTIGHWGMGFSYRPTWYQILVTAGAVDADGLPYEFAYCEGPFTNAQKQAANWPLMTPNNPNGEIIIWVQ